MRIPSKLRPVGASKGVIIPSLMRKSLGWSDNEPVTLEIIGSVITIRAGLQSNSHDSPVIDTNRPLLHTFDPTVPIQAKDEDEDDWTQE